MLLAVEPVISPLNPVSGVDTNPFVEGEYKAVWNILDPNIIQTGVTANADLGNLPYRFAIYESVIIRHEKAIPNTCKINSLTDVVTGDIKDLKFHKQYRYSNDNINWSTWLNFSTIPEWNWLDDLFMEFKYTCVPVDQSNSDNLSNKTIDLNEIILSAIVELDRQSLVVTLTKSGQCVILCPQDTWKVWKLMNVEITAGGITPSRTLTVHFRANTTSGKEWTPWMPLNNECLSKIKFDPLRFFFLELNFCRGGTDTTGEIKIYDVVFSGDFQNVSADYQKFNKFGMRSDCRTSYDTSNAAACATDAVAYPPAEWAADCNNPENKGTFKPYDQSIIPFYNQLANQVSNVFGWEVDYYKTDPDQNGTDRILHEYQLHNVSFVKSIRIVVEKNKFPQNTILANQFDLELFDTFQVHITRDEFKKAFGITERPAKWDFLFICEWNRLYQVTHAIANKDFMNTSVYYIVTLKKAQDNQHVRKNDPDNNFTIPTTDGGVKTIEESINELTSNASLDALFGTDNVAETKRIADKPQQKTLAHEEIRRSINPYVRNVEAIIENGPNVLSKNHYDLANVSSEQIAITYTAADSIMDTCDDRTFIIWFNLKTLKPGVQYNLITNQAIINGVPSGYRLNYQDSRFDLEWGNQFLEIMAPGIETNIWYCLVLRMHQTAEKWQFRLLRRQSDINPRSYQTTDLKEVFRDGGDLMPISFNIGNTPIVIYGSEIRITNIRILTTLIEETSLTNVLNQYVIREAQYLILGDNAQEKFKLKNIRYRTKEVDDYT
jgi:hypothetical protein